MAKDETPASPSSARAPCAESEPQMLVEITFRMTPVGRSCGHQALRASGSSISRTSTLPRPADRRRLGSCSCRFLSFGSLFWTTSEWSRVRTLRAEIGRHLIETDHDRASSGRSQTLAARSRTSGSTRGKDGKITAIAHESWSSHLAGSRPGIPLIWTRLRAPYAIIPSKSTGPSIVCRKLRSWIVQLLDANRPLGSLFSMLWRNKSRRGAFPASLWDVSA